MEFLLDVSAVVRELCREIEGLMGDDPTREPKQKKIKIATLKTAGTRPIRHSMRPTKGEA